MRTNEADLRQPIRQALSHLYQPEKLRADSITGSLIAVGVIRTGDETAGFLRQALEHLRPAGAAPHASPGWRQYRYLWLRYVECVTHRGIAEDLRISTRQACREHDAGLNAIASYVQSRLGAPADAEAVPRPPAARPAQNTAEASNAGPSAEAELLRLGSEPPDSPTNLREVLGSALATVARVLEARGLAVRLELSPDLPPVVVNRLALRHILLNVLGFLANDARAGITPAGDLLISAEAGTAEVELSFTVARSSLAAGAEAALEEETPGLAMARRLVEMQGGRLRTATSNDAPLSVTISLPATRATTVMLVDDNADIGRLFRRYLAGTGYYLVHARSAEKARNLVREVHPDVILLDVLLPRDDGWQLLESLRADAATAGLPVVICSVVPEGSLATSLGVEFLPKPVSQTALLLSLDRARQR
jgi:CheY-like chemotaxis protein